MPTISACTTLCHLTPAPETTWHGESSPGHHSLRISVQDQLFPPSLGNLHQGLGNLGIHVCRDTRDGSASAPTESRLLTQSTHSDRHIDRHAPLQDNTGAPRRAGSDVTGASPQYFRDGPLRRPRRHNNRLEGSDMPPPLARRRVASVCITLVPPSTIKGRDQGHSRGIEG